MEKPNIKIPIILGILFILMNLVGLDRSPVVQIDEPTLNDPAKELALYGVLRSSVFAGESGFERAYFWQPPGQVLVIASVYKLFGFGIWQTRIPGVVFGGLAVVLIYFLTMRLFMDHRAATIASLLLALEPMYIQTSRMSRMDTQCLFLVLLGIILFFRSNSDDARKYLWITLSGLLIGLAVITHPLAICWGITIGLLIIIIGPSNKFKSILVFGFAAILPGVIWLIYAMGQWQLFQQQFLHHSDWHMEKGSVLMRLINEPLRYITIYNKVPMLLLTYFVSLIWVLANRDISGKTRTIVILLFGIPFLFNALFMIKLQIGYYYLHPGLILIACSGVFIARILPSIFSRGGGLRKFGVTVFIVLLAVNVLGMGIIGRYIALAYQWDSKDYGQVNIGISENIAPGSIVWGPPDIWYATERIGAELRLMGKPDPSVHDYAVIHSYWKDEIDVPEAFTKICDIGKPVPPIFCRYRPTWGNYQMEILKSELMGPKAE